MNNVKIILVCHNKEIVKEILSDQMKNNFHIMFVGNNSVDEIEENNRIIIVRNLNKNIENHRELLTFTAWYAISKNDLFKEYEYICVLEYDVIIKNTFETELISQCKNDTYDIISFIHVTNFFSFDINESVLKLFMKKKKITYQHYENWYATSNHCLKREHLLEFVDWFYPDCLLIKQLDPIRISWYHERIFYCFIKYKNYNIGRINSLSHNFSNSHGYMHNNIKDISSDLVAHYNNNPQCEFLNKFIDNYEIFLKLNINFTLNVGSYLCDGKMYAYSYFTYKKQILLFEAAKKSKNVLLTENYLGHTALILLLANPNLNITCIDNELNKQYAILIENYFNIKINYLTKENFKDSILKIENIINNFDLVHISQQYPDRENLNKYIDMCIRKTELEKITFIVDDYNVYSDKIISNIQKNNYHCQINNEFISNGSNGNKIFDIKINCKESLLTHYKNNPTCEMLQKLIEHYDLFLQLNIDFCLGIGSYLCDGIKFEYTEKVYEKQKLLFESAKTCKNVLLLKNYMGHTALIMLLSNRNINITCIDSTNNNLILEKYFNIKINSIVTYNYEESISKIENIINDFDLIHISQQYPIREHLNGLIDCCIKQTTLEKINFIIDDYNVYPNQIIENIKYNNMNCEISNEIIVTGSNTTKKFDMKIKKKYFLVYDDGSKQFDTYVTDLLDSVKKFDKNFNIIVFHKKDIDQEFADNYKYILDQPRGGGYWLWKPYLINNILNKINEGDLLFYLDSKYFFTEKFSELYKDVLKQDILVWKNKPNESEYNLKNWCKMDIINKYNIFEETFSKNLLDCWAGAIVIRKTPTTYNIMNEWLTMCCSDDITDKSSLDQNSQSFINHRHDQSLLSIVLYKYNINLHFFENKYLQNVRKPY